ncbi:MAG TPA: multiheme c-type cytochrome [Urbifossiella sp.]|nr:multiheme c-type cytochrome [Urbifossiella sp.]
MTRPQFTHGLGWAAFALAVMLGALAGPQSPAAPLPPPSSPHQYLGVTQCIGCHSFENAAKNPGAKLYIEAGSTRFVRLNENITWVSHDLHSRAFQNIDPARNRTAKQMQDNLAKARPAGYSITAEASCLACHASIKDKSEPPARRTHASFDTIQGVSCEMCHGYASSWLKPHADIRQGADGKLGNAWREWPASAKQAWGLANLRDPAIRAETCASCHVGGAAEGRFVTHEMFAAGHPPLPPFDSPTFSRDEPRHWGLPRDMPLIVALAADRPNDAWNGFHYRSEKGEAGEVYAARHLVESTVATFRASVRHIGQLASNGTGLDFAAFDCYACHHDLKYPSPRQKRGFAGIPGRPTFRPSLTALVRIVAKNASDSSADPLKELDAIEAEMGQAFALQSFGDPAKVRAAADKFEAWAAAMLKTVRSVRYTRGKALELMRDLAAAGRDADQRIADPETAQLIAWALVTLRNEFKETGSVEPAGMAAALAELDGIVVIRVRPDPFATKKIGSDEAPVPVEDRLKERMTLLNALEPAKFRAAFQKLAPLVNDFK